MKDFLDREIKLGDKVAFQRPRYKTLHTGFVKTIGKICIRVSYEDPIYLFRNSGIREVNIYPSQCIIIESEELQLDNTIKTIKKYTL